MLIAAWPAHAAIAVVQTAFCEAQGATTCATGPITTTTGNLFIASAAYCCAAFTSITDSKGNSFSASAIAETNVPSGDGKIRQDYKAAGTGGSSHTFTITGASAAFFASLSVLEVSGAAASPLDQTAVGTDTGVNNHASPATSTTSQANELLTGLGTTTSLNPGFVTDTGAGWTERANIETDVDSQGIIAGSKIVSAIGTYTYTYVTSLKTTDGVQGISTWKESSGTRQRCIGCGTDKKVIGE